MDTGEGHIIKVIHELIAYIDVNYLQVSYLGLFASALHDTPESFSYYTLNSLYNSHLKIVYAITSYVVN